jgi:integrase
MALNDKQVQALKAADKPYRVSDRDGLYVWVTPRGTKSWRCEYRLNAAKNTCVLGGYPEMGLSAAREARLAVRKLVEAGRDPNRVRKDARDAVQAADALTFRKVAEQWYDSMADGGTWAPRTAKQTRERLTLYTFTSDFGDRPIASIDFATIQTLLRGVHAKAPAVAQLLRQYIAMIFDFAIADPSNAMMHNPARVMARYLPKHTKARHQPSVKTIEQARAVLTAVECSRTMPPVLLYHRLIALTAVRESNAREARWSEFATSGVWTIPAERMKGKQGKKRALTLPLSRQAQEVIEAARALAGEAGSGSGLVFPSLIGPKGRPCEQTTLNVVMRGATERARIGERDAKGRWRSGHVPHGWRATFISIMNQRLPGRAIVTQSMLAHVIQGVAGDYDFADYTMTPEAREFAQNWADLLLDGAPSAFALIGLAKPPKAAAGNVVQLSTKRRIAS